MKTYEIHTRWSGQSNNITLTGTLYPSESGYFYIKDEDDKGHYFPICRTTITEI